MLMYCIKEAPCLRMPLDKQAQAVRVKATHSVIQIPRFAFEKFPGAKPELTTQMKSVGEAMAIGRTFQESFQKVCPPLQHPSHSGTNLCRGVMNGCCIALCKSLLFGRSSIPLQHSWHLLVVGPFHVPL